MKQSTRTRTNTRPRSGGRRDTRPPGGEFRALGWLVRHPMFLIVPLAALVAMIRFGPVPVAWSGAAVVAGLAVWWRAHPASFDRGPGPRLRAWRRRWLAYRGRRWAGVLSDCGLTRDNQVSGREMVPRVIRVRSATPSIDTVYVRMIRGQDLRTWTDQADALAHAFCAERVAIARHKPSVLSVVIERDMPFTMPLPAPAILEHVTDLDLSALDIGDDEYGQPATVSVVGGSHLLVAGATGSGKSGVMWGLLRQLGVGIAGGWVRVHMIDLKGGTETELGADLFTTRATTMDEALDLLESARDAMKADQAHQREHRIRRYTPSVETPLDVIVIDELAMLIGYSEPRLRRQAVNLLAEIQTQGRATLWTVAGFVQEPTKDVVEVRDLFTSRLCLGVTTASHVDMVLGDGARERGALADEIPLDPGHAGIGFRIDPGSRLPRRFRAGYTSDADITELARRCPPPAQPGLAIVPDLDDATDTDSDDTDEEVS